MSNHYYHYSLRYFRVKDVILTGIGLKQWNISLISFIFIFFSNRSICSQVNTSAEQGHDFMKVSSVVEQYEDLSGVVSLYNEVGGASTIRYDNLHNYYDQPQLACSCFTKTLYIYQLC